MDNLVLVVFNDPEIVLRQFPDRMTFGVGDRDVENHQVDFDGQFEIARRGSRILLACRQFCQTY